uniref:amino acid ABC transporter ATP-binding protein n=1 Tax=Pseudothauera nasutitermitis TaxID=2565930 RepID=UPI0038B488D3
MLSVERLGKSFHGRRVLDDISFDVRAGEVIGLIGRSGSGKSTLLRCLNMLERPDVGRIRLDGEEIGFQGGQRRAVPARVLARQRAAMGMVFQHFNLWPHRTVLQNVMEGPVAVLGVPHAEAASRAMVILERIGLAAKAGSYPVTLSGGQQQRVSIARAVAMQPRLILFDEPTSALDPELVAEVLAVMTDLARSGTTMLVVTHEMRFAFEVCHRILYLDQGRVADGGTPAALLARPAGSPVRGFLGAAVRMLEDIGHA